MTYLDETTPEEMKLAKRRSLLPLGLSNWWQIGLGCALGGLSPMLYDMLRVDGDQGLRIVFPYVLLSNSPQLGLSALTSLHLPQSVIYAQFPIEGIIAWYAMRHGLGILGTALLIVMIHVMGLAVLLLMSYTTQLTH